MRDRETADSPTPPDRPTLTPRATAAKAAREARLAAALRTNLQRRKGQARARAEDGSLIGGDDAPMLPVEGEHHAVTNRRRLTTDTTGNG